MADPQFEKSHFPYYRLGEIALTVAMTGITVGVAWSFSFIIYLLGMNAGSCSGACDFALLTASVYVTPSAGAFSVLLTLALAIIFWRTGRRIWFAPIYGFFLVVLAAIVAAALNHYSIR